MARPLVLHGDARRLPLPDNSIDAIVTDPPYGLEFMGKEWDRFAPQATTARGQRSSAGSFKNDEGQPWHKARVGTAGVRSTFKCRICGGWSGSFSEARARRQRQCECDQPDLDYSGAPPTAVAFQAWCEQWAREALRVLKPGGYLLAMGSSRTAHRLASGVEDAGFELRDRITVFGPEGQEVDIGPAPAAWLYGSGFAKSRDADRSVDMELCELPGRHNMRALPPEAKRRPDDHVCPDTPEGSEWAGWGSAMKPAHEPVVCARKPLTGTLGANLLEHGTGALNIDAVRIAATDKAKFPEGYSKATGGTYAQDAYSKTWVAGGDRNPAGRWPPNVALVHAPSCRPVGVRKVRGAGWRDSDKGTGAPGAALAGSVDGFLNDQSSPHYADPDGSETVTAWECDPDCPVFLLDQQSGESRSVRSLRLKPGATPGNGITHGRFVVTEENVGGFNDQGGASRYFATFQADTGHSGASSPTDGPGSTPTGQSQPATMSTIGTTTRSTTTPPTLNASPLPTTSATTAGTERTTEPSGESSTADVSDATPTSPLASSTSAEPVPTKDIAETVSGTTSESGEQPTGTTPMPMPGSGTASGRPLSSRFFYTAKAPGQERLTINGVSHPTVKPLGLMRWLVRLVCPPGGLVLDLFGGSGTTGEAAMLEGFRSVLLDNDWTSCQAAYIRTDPFVRRRRKVTIREDGRAEEQGEEHTPRLF